MSVPDEFRISSVRLSDASACDRARGLMGYATIVVGGRVRLTGIAARLEMAS